MNFIQSPWRQAPVTTTIVGLIVASSLASWLGAHGLSELLALNPLTFSSRPWTLLTYPIAPAPVNGLLFFVLFLYCFVMFGGQVESDRGSRTFAIVTTFFTVIAGLIVVTCFHAGSFAFLSGAALLADAVFVTWCGRNQGATIRLWGILPIRSNIIGPLVALSVLFWVTPGPSLVGLLLTLLCGSAWFYGTGQVRLPAGRRQDTRGYGTRRVPTKDFVDKAMDKKREREERERLRKLFESSIDDSDK